MILRRRAAARLATAFHLHTPWGGCPLGVLPMLE
jgi:hypothetical protein